MAVTVNATAVTVATGSSITTLTNTTLTVVAGATALLAWLTFGGQAANPSAITVTWDSGGTNQAMTQIAIATNGATFGSISILYGLLNPTLGNKTLSASWTGAVSLEMDAIAFAGTATDTIANAFQNTNSATGSSATSAITATSAVNNINIFGGATRGASYNAATGTGVTSVWLSNVVIGATGAQATGAASIAYTATLQSSAAWAVCCIDVCVPVVAASPFPYQPWAQLAPILAQ